jgi:Flp pilus assembly protein TadD
VAVGCLVACQWGAGDATSRNAPPPVDARGEAVDGLTVGDRLMDAGEYELALKAYLRAASEEGADADVLTAIGAANLKLGRLGQAEQILRRAVEADPDSVPALNNLGVVLIEQGKAGEAKRVFEQAYALDSGETESIRENLRLAIARSELTVYPDAEDPSVFSLVREGEGEAPILSEL